MTREVGQGPCPTAEHNQHLSNGGAQLQPDLTSGHSYDFLMGAQPEALSDHEALLAALPECKIYTSRFGEHSLRPHLAKKS